MYSILLKVTTSSSDRWKYLYNDDGSLYQDDDLGRVRQKVIELLSDHVLSAIKVVANKRAVSHIVIEGNPDEPGQWLPEVTIDDNGKVLMVINGEWDKGEIEVGNVLPDVTVDDNGKVLKVVEGEWAAAEEGGGTDENVKQTVTNSGDVEYGVLLSNNTYNTGTETAQVRKTNGIGFNVEQGTLTLNRAFSGGGYHIVSHMDIVSPTASNGGDIRFDLSTWDGSNKSLRSALSTAGSKVEQNEVANINDDFELLLSGVAAINSDVTNTTKKSVNLKYNPSSKTLTLEGSNNGITTVEGGHIIVKRNMEGISPIIDMVDQNADKELIIGSSAIEFRNDYETPTKTMSLINGNIILNGDTWDGTNASLKDTITALVNRITALETQLANVNVISNQTIDEICI